MKTRPILFSGPMVRAILEGRKTQTRRPINPARINRNEATVKGWLRNGKADLLIPLCPYGQPGDRLWVRETWCKDPDGISSPDPIHYLATASQEERDWLQEVGEVRWRPSIYMPRAASRITLEIVSVRVERVQEISNDDAEEEGVPIPGEAINTPRYEFRKLWDSINAARGFGWDKNPWVWVLEFRRIA